MNEYLKQAKEFCTKNNTTVKVVFCHKGYHFDGDKQKRDIYNITITRGLQSYCFKFGDSIHNTEKNQDRNRDRKRRGLIIPNEYDILACLTTYEVGDFDDFVDCFGYTFETEKEYIKVKSTHIAVKEEYRNVNRLFNDVMEELQEIC